MLVKKSKEKTPCTALPNETVCKVSKSLSKISEGVIFEGVAYTKGKLSKENAHTSKQDQ